MKVYAYEANERIVTVPGARRPVYSRKQDAVALLDDAFRLARNNPGNRIVLVEYELGSEGKKIVFEVS